MQCPICSLDLSPLDLYSRQEHCELCLENGPSILTTDETGQLTIKRNVAPNKQRKICPICDKTFQNLNIHFKVCAIKNDIPPQLMLEYWDKINSECKKPKKFPRELLDAFVTKCVKEGRIGDQVDFARALSLSMADSDPQTSSTVLDDTIRPDSNQVLVETAPDVNQVLMSNAIAAQRVTTDIVTNRPVDKKKRYRLELVNDSMKRANILLRMDRELAATRSRRHEEALAASRSELCSQQSDDIAIIDDPEICDTRELNKLFFKARLKDCTGSSECSQAICKGHELMLLMEEFRVYAGTSMDANPTRQREELIEYAKDVCEDDEAEIVHNATVAENNQPTCVNSI